MTTKMQRTRILLAIALAVLGIFVPYMIAWRISPDGTVFTGFLMNPIDGFSYLAKMRQGYDGSWLFRFSYTIETGEEVLLFIFYILLGHLSRVLNLSLIITFHLARVLISAGFFVLLFIFFDRIFEQGRLKWAGFLFSLFGSGLGWLALLALGRQTIDLWVPEAIPFLTAYSNPHFPLAASAFIAGILLVYRKGKRTFLQLLLAFVSGLVLGAVLPFSAIPLFLVLGIWMLWEFAANRPSSVWSVFQNELSSLLALFLGALPWMIYDYGLSLSHPVISGWNAQNLTPSPPLIDTLLGFGLMFAGATISLFWKPWQLNRAGRLLTTWFVIGLLLLYAPLPFQRRLSMGLYLPMAGLTAWWLSRQPMSGRALRLAETAVLALSAPSLLLVLAAGLSAAARGDTAITYSREELAAYDWIDARVEANSLVLTDPLYGNRLPAFAPVRVLYGHPFETPNAEFWRSEVVSLLSWSDSNPEALSKLDEYGVDWVLIDISDSRQTPTWLDELSGAQQFEDILLLRDASR